MEEKIQRHTLQNPKSYMSLKLVKKKKKQEAKKFSYNFCRQKSKISQKINKQNKKKKNKIC